MIRIIVAGFIFSLLLTIISIKRLGKLGIISEDLHKENKPKHPKIGGISVAVAFSVCMLIAYFTTLNINFIAVLLAFLISASIGLFDDLFGFPPIRKFILVSLAAAPLLWLVSWEIPVVLFVFAMVGIVSNWTNMLAGFNGLEIGTGMIAVTFLALDNIGSQNSNIMFIYAACLLAFLIFNKYPAKVFPGDVGTLPIGTMLVAGYLLGARFLTLTILLIPYGLDMLLKLLSVGIMSRSDYEPTEIKNGYLIPRDKYVSLSKIVMKLRPMKEWQLVAVIWLLEIGLGIVALLR